MAYEKIPYSGWIVITGRRPGQGNLHYLRISGHRGPQMLRVNRRQQCGQGGRSAMHGVCGKGDNQADAANGDRFRNDRGVALLTVLLVTALMTVLVLSMTWQRQLELRRTANLIESDQVLLLTLGLEQWAGKILLRDRSQGNSDNLGENWAVGLPPTPVEQGMVSGDILDLQGRFNLNNLVLAADQAGQDRAEKQLGRLLELCGGDPRTAAAVADWLDRDGDMRINGAEDRDYLIRQPPYRTGNRPMVSPTELLLVNGINADIYNCLADSIATLPEETSLNVNTATPLTIAALSDKLALEQANEIVKERPPKGYEKLEDFQAQLVGTGLTDPAGLGLNSNYFLVEARANFGHAEMVLYSVMHRSETTIKVIGRSIGTY